MSYDLEPLAAVRLVRADDLASALGFSSANGSFREWCRQVQLSTVPSRRGYFDPKLVRRRLDELQDLREPARQTPAEAGPTFTQLRRVRLAQNQ